MTDPLIPPVFTLDAPTRPTPDRQPPAPYPVSFAFDFATGQVPLDGTGRAPVVDGYQAAAQWAVFQVLTERFAHRAFSFRVGTEIRRMMRRYTPAALEVAVQAEIRDAILRDTRFSDVDQFAFRRDGDRLYVDFRLVFAVGTDLYVELTLSPRPG
jgi:hypothetical protein